MVDWCFYLTTLLTGIFSTFLRVGSRHFSMTFSFRLSSSVPALRCKKYFFFLSFLPLFPFNNFFLKEPTHFFVYWLAFNFLDYSRFHHLSVTLEINFLLTNIIFSKSRIISLQTSAASVSMLLPGHSFVALELALCFGRSAHKDGSQDRAISSNA